jgi:hypothetical protein
MDYNMEYRQRLIGFVGAKLEIYLQYNPSIYSLSRDDKDSIISTGVSVLETKFPEIGPGYSGGSFVCAVVDNNLMEAVGRADSININYLKFYCQLLYNFSPYQIGYTGENASI